MTTFNKKLIPSAVSVIAFRDTESLLLASGRERHLLVRDEIDALIDSHLEAPRGLRFIDTSCEESSESLGNSDNTREKEFNMNIRESEEEVVVDLFENKEEGIAPSFIYQAITPEALANKVVKLTTDARAELARVKNSAGYYRRQVESLDLKIQRLEEASTSTPTIVKAIEKLSAERSILNEKYEEADASFDFLAGFYDPLDVALTYFLNEVLGEGRDDLRKKVEREVERIRMETPEVFAFDKAEKNRLSDMLREGSGKYLAAEDSMLPIDAFIGLDDMIHMGHDVMPEEEIKGEDRRRFVIPYLRNAEGEPITFKVPKAMKDDDDKIVFEKVDQKALAVFVIMEDKMTGRRVMAPLYRSHEKRVNLVAEMIQAAETENWNKYNRLVQANNLPSKKAIAAAAAEAKTIRELFWDIGVSLEKTFSLWTPCRGVYANGKLIMGNFVTCPMKLFRKDVILCVQVFDTWGIDGIV